MFALRSRLHTLINFHLLRNREEENVFRTLHFIRSLNFNSYNQKIVKPSISDEDDAVQYDIKYPYRVIKPHDARLTKFMVASKNRKARYKSKMIMLEGKRLICDALMAGLKPIMILFTRKNLIEDLPLPHRYVTREKPVLYKIPYKSLQNWSDLTTSPGITGLFTMPNLEDRVLSYPTLPITLICDNIREPGNLGAILRIAAALPVHRVILLTGCVDLWDPKVTRSSCGAMFHLKIQNNATWEDIKDTCSGNVIIADHLSTDEQNTDIKAEEFDGDLELETTDSSNEYEDENIVNRINWRKVADVPVVPYYNISYKNYDSFIIVIGGETEGLSLESLEFAKKNNGLRVNIPLAKSVTSLNSAAAIGIITFEMKRQLSIE